jgi:hypothetical protein
MFHASDDMQDAQLAQQQQQKRKHNSRGRTTAPQRSQKDSSSIARTANGRVSKHATSVGWAAQRLAQLCLQSDQ